jgi:hypothetical protein
MIRDEEADRKVNFLAVISLSVLSILMLAAFLYANL